MKMSAISKTRSMSQVLVWSASSARARNSQPSFTTRGIRRDHDNFIGR